MTKAVDLDWLVELLRRDGQGVAADALASLRAERETLQARVRELERECQSLETLIGIPALAGEKP